MQVEIDKEKMGEIVRYVEREIDLDDLRQKALAFVTASRGPRNYETVKLATQAFTRAVAALFVTVEEAGELIRQADPSVDVGGLKREAIVRIGDDLIKFKGLFGRTVLERFDHKAIGYVVDFGIELLNEALGREWAKGLLRDSPESSG